MASTPSQPSQTQSYLLLSIAFSHCNEKARWALSYYHVPYTQHLLLPWIHIISTSPIVSSGLSLRESRDRVSSPYSTPCLAIYSPEPSQPGNPNRNQNQHQQLTSSLHDSHDILVYLSEHFSSPDHVNLYLSCGPSKASEIHALEKRYDEGLGRYGVHFFYLEMTKMNKWHAMLPFASMGFRNGVGMLQSMLWFGLSPLLGRMITGVMGMTPETYEVALRICREIYREASEMLEKSPYLAGDRLSAADITFSGLSLFILGITHEEGYQLISLPPKAWSPRARAFQQELRATRAGQHVLRLYKEERYFGAALPRQKKTFGGLW